MSAVEDDVAVFGVVTSGPFISQHRTLLLAHLQIFQYFLHPFQSVATKLMRIELNIRGLAIGDCRLAADECRLP